MATITLSSLSLHSLAAQRPNLSIAIPSSSSSLTLPWREIRLRSHGLAAHRITEQPNRLRGVRILRSAESETLETEAEGEAAPEGGEGDAGSSADQQAVSVPVSASDTLTMFFQADGTMSEAAIPGVTRALEQLEGVSNLKVHVIEGVASVELEKLTTVQATGVASSLVESIQGSGFKLQTLNLSFEDQESLVA